MEIQIIQEMLSNSERKQLRKQLRPAVQLALLVLLVTTGVNLAFQYMDVLTGVDSVERPPLFRFFVIEVLVLVFSGMIFFTLSAKVRRDLRGGKKVVEGTSVLKKFAKRINGQLAYKLQLRNKQIIDVNKETFNLLSDGSEIQYGYAPRSLFVFDVIPK
jgi:hypothetical protein